jgi:hypothetical protein
MGNRRLYEIECLYKFGTLGSEGLKVTSLNLFHPTISPLSKESVFSILRHSLNGRGITDFRSLGILEVGRSAFIKKAYFHPPSKLGGIQQAFFINMLGE